MIAMLSLWILIGLSLTIGYEVQAQNTQHQVELVDTQTITKTPGVSYIQLLQQIKNVGYISDFLAFSFESLLQSQCSNTKNIYNIQQRLTHVTQQTIVIDHLQRFIISDDTDSIRFPVFLS